MAKKLFLRLCVLGEKINTYKKSKKSFMIYCNKNYALVQLIMISGIGVRRFKPTVKYVLNISLALCKLKIKTKKIVFHFQRTLSFSPAVLDYVCSVYDL
jgi:hypothetical protein